MSRKYGFYLGPLPSARENATELKSSIILLGLVRFPGDLYGVLALGTYPLCRALRWVIRLSSRVSQEPGRRLKKRLCTASVACGVVIG